VLHSCYSRTTPDFPFLHAYFITDNDYLTSQQFSAEGCFAVWQVSFRLIYLTVINHQSIVILDLDPYNYK